MKNVLNFMLYTHPKMRIYQLKHANLHFRNLQSFRKERNMKTGGRENTKPSSERVEQNDNQTNKYTNKNKAKQNKIQNKTKNPYVQFPCIHFSFRFYSIKVNTKITMVIYLMNVSCCRQTEMPVKTPNFKSCICKVHNLTHLLMSTNQYSIPRW